MACGEDPTPLSFADAAGQIVAESDGAAVRGGEPDADAREGSLVDGRVDLEELRWPIRGHSAVGDRYPR